MLSIVIPCYNCVSTIKRAIESVLSQRYQNYELLLIDNRSTDGTIHILNHYKAQYPDKVRVYHEYKRGAPAARNKGLALAKGDWIQFLDSDDELYPEKLARQIQLAEKSAAGIVVGNYLMAWTQGRRLRQSRRASAKDPWEGLITSALGITSSNLWRKSDLLAVKGWDEGWTSSQEYDLLFRLLKNGSEIVFDDAFHTLIHQSENSTSKSTDKKKLIQIVRNRINLRCNIKEYLNQNNLLTPSRSRSIDTYIYFELKRNSWILDEYVNEYLKQNTLEVPWNTMVKINARVALRKLRYHIQGVFNPSAEWNLKNLS